MAFNGLFYCKTENSCLTQSRFLFSPALSFWSHKCISAVSKSCWNRRRKQVDDCSKKLLSLGLKSQYWGKTWDHWCSKMWVDGKFEISPLHFIPAILLLLFTELVNGWYYGKHYKTISCHFQLCIICKVFRCNCVIHCFWNTRL